MFKNNWTLWQKKGATLVVLPKDENWSIRGFIFESTLTTVMNVVKLQMSVPWHNERINAGQKIHRYT